MSVRLKFSVIIGSLLKVVHRLFEHFAKFEDPSLILTHFKPIASSLNKLKKNPSKVFKPWRLDISYVELFPIACFRSFFCLEFCGIYFRVLLSSSFLDWSNPRNFRKDSGRSVRDWPWRTSRDLNFYHPQQPKYQNQLWVPFVDSETKKIRLSMERDPIMYITILL